MSIDKIPVSFITGFLGSGKTTFIEKLVEKFSGKKIVYLVNEFSPKDVDGERLDLSDGELVKIPGGSIFCKCLTGQFIKVLNDVAKMEIDGVVIEASGIANPRIANDMFVETKLDKVFDITSIVAIIDPRSFLKLCRTLPNIIEQVAASTHIIVNKKDIYSVEKMEETAAAAARINSSARLVQAEFCSVDIDVFQEGCKLTAGGEYAKCKDPNFCQVVFNINDSKQWAELKNKLPLLGDDLYRVKGSLELETGKLTKVDYDGGEWFYADDKVADIESSGEIVVIASGYKEPALQALKKKFA